MNIGVYLKDTYTQRGRSSTLEWTNDLAKQGHSIYFLFPRDVKEMQWREAPYIPQFSEFFREPNNQLSRYQVDMSNLRKIRKQFSDQPPSSWYKRLRGESHEHVQQANELLTRKKRELEAFRKDWVDEQFPYTAKNPSLDMLLFRKAGRYFQRDNAQQVRAIADAYPAAGQINDAQLVAGMDKTFMNRLDSEYSLETHFPASIEGVVDSVQYFQDAIVKPLDGRAGRGVARISATSDGLAYIQQTSKGVRTQHLDSAGLEKQLAGIREEDPRVVVQRYEPRIQAEGELRVMVVGGEPVGCVVTRPRGEEAFLSNVARGASAHELTEVPGYAQEAVDYLVSFMRQNNISVARGDLIGSRINEINLVSPGTKAFGKNRSRLRKKLVEVVEEYPGVTAQAS